MKPSLLAIRSIGAEFANRIYGVVAIIVSAICALFLGLNLWLTTLSNWWWLLFMALIVGTSIAIGFLVVIKLVIKSVTPVQSKSQRVQTKAFVDKLQSVSDAAQTPKIVLMFRIVRDIAAPRTDGFIATLSSNTASLKRDFIALSDTFKK
ncbi:MAG TPA: hypothetical protein VFS65_00470 [Candidatus Saccharimonadales bacterium]|nr:hypothetical protein [Candidatus Saccharimonadales bacterium]